MADSEKHTHTIGVATIEAFAGLFWPGAVLVIVLMFRTPIGDVISLVGQQIPIGRAYVEVGGSKYPFRRDGSCRNRRPRLQKYYRG